MKKIITFLLTIMISSFILISCGSGSIENNSWSGEDIIAGVGFNYTLKTSSNNTYTLVGNSEGISVDERGTFKKIKDNEIKLTSGEFKGSRFVLDGSTLKWYLDTGDLFMSLH